MTRDEIFCNICEEPIADMPIFVEDSDGAGWHIDDETRYESMSDALNAIEELALWNLEWNTYVCMGCITSAYEIAHGLPLRKRIRQTITDLRWRWWKWRHPL